MPRLPTWRHRSGKALTGVFPRTSRRASFVARREAGGGGGTARVTLSGDINGTVVTDAKGRLQRLEFPGSRITGDSRAGLTQGNSQVEALLLTR